MVSLIKFVANGSSYLNIQCFISNQVISNFEFFDTKENCPRLKRQTEYMEHFYEPLTIPNLFFELSAEGRIGMLGIICFWTSTI